MYVRKKGEPGAPKLLVVNPKAIGSVPAEGKPPLVVHLIDDEHPEQGTVAIPPHLFPDYYEEVTE